VITYGPLGRKLYGPRIPYVDPRCKPTCVSFLIGANSASYKVCCKRACVPSLHRRELGNIPSLLRRYARERNWRGGLAENGRELCEVGHGRWSPARSFRRSSEWISCVMKDTHGSVQVGFTCSCRRRTPRTESRKDRRRRAALPEGRAEASRDSRESGWPDTRSRYPTRIGYGRRKAP
jgi:hypothetical protein